jgi:hypothetical protein
VEGGVMRNDLPEMIRSDLIASFTPFTAQAAKNQCNPKTTANMADQN